MSSARLFCTRLRPPPSPQSKQSKLRNAMYFTYHPIPVQQDPAQVDQGYVARFRVDSEELAREHVDHDQGLLVIRYLNAEINRRRQEDGKEGLLQDLRRSTTSRGARVLPSVSGRHTAHR